MSTSTTSTAHAEVKKARTAVINGQSVFAFELMLLLPVADLDQGAIARLSVYANYLNGRHALPRMALVSEGDVLTLELEGLSVSESFIEYDRIVNFKVNCAPPVQTR